MRRGLRSCLRAIPSLALVAVLAAGASADSLRSVREVLRGHWAGDDRSQAEVVRGLSSLGLRSIPTLFGLYAGELDLLSGGAEHADAEWWCDPGRFGALYLQALGELPPDPVVEHLRHETRGDATTELRCSAIRVLGALGATEGLELLLDLAEDFGPLPLRYRSVRTPLEQAFASVLRGHPGAFRDLGERVDELSDELIDIVTAAAQSSPGPEAVELLERLLGRGPGLDGRILAVMAAMRAERPWRFSGEVHEVVQPFLSSEDWELRSAAVVALARIGDFESFPEIAALLHDEHPAVARAAGWALRELADSTRDDSSEAWLDWYAAEMDWWDSGHSRMRSDLFSSEPREVMAAMRELSERPLLRDEAALTLSEVLDHFDGDLAVATCRALEQLGSRTAVPALVDALSYHEEAVRTAAGAALVRLTGQALPPDHEAWLTFLEN